jgi:hypothetical protein
MSEDLQKMRKYPQKVSKDLQKRVSSSDVAHALLRAASPLMATLVVN